MDVIVHFYRVVTVLFTAETNFKLATRNVHSLETLLNVPGWLKASMMIKSSISGFKNGFVFSTLRIFTSNVYIYPYTDINGILK